MTKAKTLPQDRPAAWAVLLLSASVALAAASVFLLAVF